MRALSILILWLASCSAEPPEPVPADLVIETVTVINLETGKFEPTDAIVISDNVITHMGTAVPYDATAKRIDGNGAYVIPGFWDAHVHSVSAAEWHFPIMVQHGVTSVRNMHTTEPQPFEKITALKQRVASGELLGPTMIANGPIVDGTHAAWPGTVVVATPDEAEGVVLDLKSRGADFIKVYDSIAPEVYVALIEAANTHGLSVDGHMPARLDPNEAARLGHRSVEHLTGIVIGCSSDQARIQQEYADLFLADPLPFPQNMMAFFDLVGELNSTWDDTKCRALVEAYAEGQIVVTPTLVNGVSMTNPLSLIEAEGAKDLVPEDIMEWWMPELSSPRTQTMQVIMAPLEANTPRIVALLNAAGVPITVGTDVGNPFIIPGRSVHTEMELLVDAGLSPLDAVRSATIIPAEIFAPGRQTGRVAVGYEADLVLLKQDPLEDITNTRSVKAVVLRGSLVEPSGD